MKCKHCNKRIWFWQESIEDAHFECQVKAIHARWAEYYNAIYDALQPSFRYMSGGMKRESIVHHELIKEAEREYMLMHMKADETKH